MNIVYIPSNETKKQKEKITHCRLIRKEVFIEEQQVPYEIEQDGLDAISSHLLLTKENIPIGTLRMRKTEEGIKLERIALIKKYRGSGFGKHLVTHAIKIAEKEYPYSPIYIHSQESASTFYSSLGFVATGEKTIEANIVHLTMVYKR